MRDEIREAKPSPVAFLSYASENKELATRIAEDLQRHGVDTFFAGWEIRPGESIRAKIPPSATSLFRRSPSIIAVPPG